MKKYEYRTKVFNAKGVWGGELDAAEFNDFLNDMGRDCWELIETMASNIVYGKTGFFICIFKRELV